MDSDVILAKIESLKRCIERIESKKITTPDVLQNDYDLQDIISVNLERAVQQSVDIASHILADFDTAIPATMADCFNGLTAVGILSDSLANKMKKAVGFRNTVVHDYQSINWKMVFSIITINLNDFRDFIKSILAWLEKKEKEK
jgi:uncharacterized protein YutE (UPF0331/DUF86 family)